MLAERVAHVTPTWLTEIVMQGGCPPVPGRQVTVARSTFVGLAELSAETLDDLRHPIDRLLGRLENGARGGSANVGPLFHLLAGASVSHATGSRAFDGEPKRARNDRALVRAVERVIH